MKKSFTVIDICLLKICLFLLYLAQPFSGQAQVAGFKNYGQEDGLTSSYGYRIKQDRKGFIWIGGDNGLFRFDGTEFKNYTEELGFENTEIIGGEPLANGEIFIIPFLGVNGYLKNNKLFTSENNPELKKLQFGNNLPQLEYNDSLDQLFMSAGTNPPSVYIYKNEKVAEFPIFQKNKSSRNITFCLFYDFFTGNMYYNDQDQQVFAYNIYSKKHIRCNLCLKNNVFSCSKERFLVARQKDSIVVYELVAPFSFKRVKAFEIKENIYQIVIDGQNKLWVCLRDGGVLYFKDALGEPVPFSQPVKFLDEYMINDLLRDRDGNMWFNTKNDGVFFIAARQFRMYIDLPLKNNNFYLTAITANKQSVFLGRNASGGSVYHSGQLKELVLDKYNKFECRAVFANEKTAVFGQGSLVFSVNLSDYKIERVYYLGPVKNIVPYATNSVLLCTSMNLFAYNFDSRQSSKLLEERIYTALPYDPDSLFVGSFNDLYKFNVKTKVKKAFLKDLYFCDLKKIRPNVYAGATRRDGVVFFNSGRLLKRITKKDGLASNQIKKIEVEDEHTIWASTSLGLSRIDLKSGKIAVKNFTRIDGLPSDRVSGCVIRNDTIYVATSKGLGIFSIKQLLDQDKAINKQVIINSVSLGGKQVFDPDGRYTATYPDNTVIFDLSFLDYASQGKISYRYKVDGLSQGWRISSSPKIILNSLPPGKYTFRVYGLGYNDRQSEKETILAFEIKPRFWQSRWFYSFVVLLLAVGVMLIISFFVKKRRDKKIKALLYEKKIAELELQAIKAQINPHFIYNCLNSIQFLLYKKDYTETENYLGRFAKMIRKTLLYSEKTFMPIKEEIEYLTLYLDMEKLRFKGFFNYKIEVSAGVDTDWEIPSLLIQPFVENAIKHGISGLPRGEGLIEICFEYTYPRLSIIIRDNGIGIRDKAQLLKKTDSFGIRLSRKRVEAFRQLFDTDITMEINNLWESGARGTEVTLHLNLSL